MVSVDQFDDLDGEDWTEDDALGTEEILSRFNQLEPANEAARQAPPVTAREYPFRLIVTRTYTGTLPAEPGDSGRQLDLWLGRRPATTAIG